MLDTIYVLDVLNKQHDEELKNDAKRLRRRNRRTR